MLRSTQHEAARSAIHNAHTSIHEQNVQPFEAFETLSNEVVVMSAGLSKSDLSWHGMNDYYTSATVPTTNNSPVTE